MTTSKKRMAEIKEEVKTEVESEGGEYNPLKVEAVDLVAGSKEDVLSQVVENFKNYIKNNKDVRWKALKCGCILRKEGQSFETVFRCDACADKLRQTAIMLNKIKQVHKG